eukprot:11127803-Alexandrium_andersonii.AAC.1
MRLADARRTRALLPAVRCPGYRAYGDSDAAAKHTGQLGSRAAAANYRTPQLPQQCGEHNTGRSGTSTLTTFSIQGTRSAAGVQSLIFHQVRVRACRRACMRACVRACGRACVCVCEGERGRHKER